jgi:transcriptional regulator with XRE-family HTH domain
LSTTPDLDGAGLGAMLGPRLRERRMSLGRTLAEIAAQADVSPGYISAIEKGTSIPSLPVLARIAHAIELSLAEILRSSNSALLARGRIADTAGVEDLAARGSELEIACHRVEPGESGDAPVSIGTGDVFLFLPRGRLEVTIDDGVFELAPGDALHCDHPRTVQWRARGRTASIALWVAAAKARGRGSS